MKVLISNYKYSHYEIRNFKKIGGYIVEKGFNFDLLVIEGDNLRSIKFLLAIAKGK